MFRLLALATLFVSVGTGCTPIVAGLLIAEFNDGPDGVSTDFMESNAEGTMRGAVGAVSSGERELTQASVWTSPGYFDFDLHAVEGDWMMLGGGFDSTALVEGETVVLSPDQHWVIGCSGPEVYSAEYDEGAEQVTVSQETLVIDGAELVEVTITATFADGNEATAVVVRPAPGPGQE